MNQFDVVQGFLEFGETGSPPPEQLSAKFHETVQALGFRYFACCSHVDPFHPPPDAVMMHNYPRGWMRTYSEEKLYEIDPILKHAEANPRPFFWHTIVQADSLTKRQQIMLAEAAGYGLTNGYTVPFRLSWVPGTLRASCTVIPDNATVDPRNYLAIEVASTYLYFCESRRHAPWLSAVRVELTRRERECLALVGQGKGDWTIGRMLGLGESTVHYHIEQLKRRLRVATRSQAVVQALMSGQISFGDVTRRLDGTTECKDCITRLDLH
jgi:LuxR family quorum-sensing system transcriptional regulator CciR